MKYFLILLLFPIFSYSQNIGEKIPLKIKSGMNKEVYQNETHYTFESKDSSIIIYTKSERIYAIDYIIPLEKWQKEGLTWVTRYTAIGKNTFYNQLNGDYYFVVYTEGKFIIQLRNEKKTSSL